MNLVPNQTHQIMSLNPHGRDFVCGDLQGCHDELLKLMGAVDFDKSNDRLFCLGDLVDRGMKSLECLRLLGEPWFFSLMGNHEEMMIDAIEAPYDLSTWYSNGGGWFSRLGDQDKKEVTAICAEYVEHLPLSMTLVSDDGFSIGLIHAGPPDDWNDSVEGRHSRHTSLWDGSGLRPAFAPEVKNVDVVLVGHMVGNYIRKFANIFYLDTGAGFVGGQITLIEISKNVPEFIDCLSDRALSDKKNFKAKVKLAETAGMTKPGIIYEQVNSCDIIQE